jgi:hypothetical protein
MENNELYLVSECIGVNVCEDTNIGGKSHKMIKTYYESNHLVIGTLKHLILDFTFK